MTTISSSKQIHSAESKTSDRVTAGVLFYFAAALFLLLTTVSESMYPNFSLQTNAISDLAAMGTRTAPIEETAILGLGICWSVGAYYLFRNTNRKGLMILNVLPGIGFTIAGLSPENVNVVIHSIGTVAFPIGAIAVIASYKMINSPLRYLSLALGAISLVSTFFIFAGYRLVCGTCGYQQGMSETLLGLGGWESLIIYPILIWLMGFGSYVLATSTRRGTLQ